MFEIILICALPVLLSLYWYSTPARFRDVRALYIAILGYVPRLLVSGIVRNFPFFSYGATGDAPTYQAAGEVAARLWRFNGLRYVTSAELPELAETTLPANLFGLVDYFNGDAALLGCTAVVAAMACGTALNMYKLSCELGCRRRVALAAMFVAMFLPTFVYYTSDTHKDGIVAFFVFVVLGSALRLGRKFSMLQLVIGVIGLLGLWLTRYYLVFIMAVPLTLGVFGTRSSGLRGVVAVLGLAIAGLAIAAYSNRMGSSLEVASAAYSRGTAEESLRYNAAGGSGVIVEGSGPGAFALKLMYSLFAPFPWQSGSIGMQLAKLEMPLWYYFAYRAVKSARFMWRQLRPELTMFATFVLPTTLAYTLAFSNVGIVVRERVPVVLCTILLATVSWGVEVEGQADKASEEAVKAEPAGVASPRRSKA